MGRVGGARPANVFLRAGGTLHEGDPLRRLLGQPCRLECMRKAVGIWGFRLRPPAK